ncbi:hypothetical protein [Terriglobus sp. RCC_193]|uniref:hypothetical protein n=1 Tax=Terriglobus sp. RCC_193 TaxID=3239218 RepID=UPI003523149C
MADSVSNGEDFGPIKKPVLSCDSISWPVSQSLPRHRQMTHASDADGHLLLKFIVLLGLAFRYTMYKAFASDCGSCSLKARCTQAPIFVIGVFSEEPLFARTDVRVAIGVVAEVVPPI